MTNFLKVRTEIFQLKNKKIKIIDFFKKEKKRETLQFNQKKKMKT